MAEVLMQGNPKSFIMYVDNEYDISIRYKGAERSFRIRTAAPDGKAQYLVLNVDNAIDADVWQKYDLLFTLEADEDSPDGKLMLSPEYEGKADPELVSEISNIIKNAEED